MLVSRVFPLLLVAFAFVALPPATFADQCFDALPQKMLAALEGLTPHDVDTVIQSELRMWGIDPTKTSPPIELHVPAFADYIAQAHGCWKQNNIIADNFCEWERLMTETMMDKSAQDMKDMFQQAFIHSIFLNLLNEQIKENYPRAKALFQAIQKEIDEKLKPSSFMGFKIFQHATMFESGKLNLILPALAKSMDLIINKQPMPKDAYRCGQRINGVSINIGEAGVFDLNNGYYDNAEAAIPMMLAPNVETDQPLLEAKPTHFDEKLKVVVTSQPFPTEWAKLYESWNLAFTMGNYENFPMFWAKLLNPSTSCYHHAPGVYLHNRGTTLLLHILHEMFWRYKIGPLHNYHLSNRAATLYHGTLNKRAAEAYQAKVDAVDPHLINKDHVKELKDMIDAYRKGNWIKGNMLKMKYGFQKIYSLMCRTPAEAPAADARPAAGAGADAGHGAAAAAAAPAPAAAAAQNGNGGKGPQVGSKRSRGGNRKRRLF